MWGGGGGGPVAYDLVVIARCAATRRVAARAGRRSELCIETLYASARLGGLAKLCLRVGMYDVWSCLNEIVLVRYVRFAGEGS